MRARPIPSFMLLAQLLLVLSLAACGNKGDLVRPPPDEQSGAEQEDWEDDAMQDDDDAFDDPWTTDDRSPGDAP